MGKESMLEDDQELELEDLDDETEEEADVQPEEDLGVPDTETDREADEDGEFELEDLDDEAEGEADVRPEAENGVPDTETDRDSGEEESGAGDVESGEAESGESGVPAQPGLYERGVARGAAFAEKLKGTASDLLDVALPKAEGLIDKHKGKFFNAYDSVMDLKDEMHYASKDSGGGFKGFKSAAGVLGRHIKESDTYNKFMNSAVGQGIQATGRGISWTKDKIKSGASWAGNKIKSGASWAADKFNGTKLGKWIQEKRANKSDEPGFFSKAWDKMKTGAGALAGKVKSGASWAWDKAKSGAAWAGDKVKSGASWAGNKIKSGASWAADKFNGTKLGKWIQEKRANKSDEPGFFSKAWDTVKTGAGALAGKVKNGMSIAGDAIKGVASRTGNAIKSGVSRAGSAIKSGASYLGNVVKNSASLAMDKFNKTRLGKWVQEKLADKSDEPGFFGKAWNKVKTGSRALAKKVKSGVAWLGEQKDRAGKWIGEQKEWADQKVGDLKMWKRLHIDEPLDNHEHERRVRFMERQGDSGYGKRYNDLVGELKELPGIERLKGLAEGKILEEVLLELEKGEDSVDEKVGAAAAKGESLVGKPSGILDVQFIKNKAKDRFGGGVDQISDGLSYGKAALGAVKSGAGIVTAQRLKKDLSRMEKETSDPTLRKGMRFAKKNADKKTVNNSFDIVKTGVTAAGRIFKQKTAAKVANKVIGLAESAVTSGMDKETRKESLKGLLGGVEGYRQLKERYKLKAPEMRRAIRQAIGVSSENDVVNMDRLTTSHDIMKNAQDGDQASRDFAKRVKAGSSGDLYKAMGGDKSIFMTQHYGTQEA